MENTVVIKHADGAVTLRGEGVGDIYVRQFVDGDIMIKQDEDIIILPSESMNEVLSVLDLMSSEDEDAVFESEDDFGFSADADEFDVEFTPEEWAEMLEDERDEDAEAAFLRGFMDAMFGVKRFADGEIDEYHV